MPRNWQQRTKTCLNWQTRKKNEQGRRWAFLLHPPHRYFLQQIFTGPSQVVLSANVMQMFGNATRQIIQTQDPGDEEDDIIDLDET